jgi:hypothetical protein
MDGTSGAPFLALPLVLSEIRVIRGNPWPILLRVVLTDGLGSHGADGERVGYMLESKIMPIAKLAETMGLQA